MPCGARGAGDDTPSAPFGRYGSGGAARCMATRRRDRDAAGGDDEPSCDAPPRAHSSLRGVAAFLPAALLHAIPRITEIRPSNTRPLAAARWEGRR